MGKNLKYCSEFTHDPKFGFTGSAGKTPVAGYLRKAAGGKVREHYSLATTGKLKCGGSVKKFRHGGMGSYKRGGAVPSYSAKPLVGSR